MLWLVLALSAALCESLKNLFAKKGIERVHPLVAAWGASAFALPFLLLMLWMQGAMPKIGNRFWLALVIGGGLNVVAILQLMRAILVADLSLTIPFLTLTPLFLLLTSPLIVGEMPTAVGLIGIVCIVCGSFILQWPEPHQRIWAPLQSLWKNPGPRRAVSVAFLYSVTSNMDKIGVQESTPFFWSAAITLFMFATLGIMMWGCKGVNPGLVSTKMNVLWVIGFFQALTLFFHNSALILATVPSVIAVKRTSVLFAVLWGAIFLHEPRLRERLLGAVFMILGAILIGYGERLL